MKSASVAIYFNYILLYPLLSFDVTILLLNALIRVKVEDIVKTPGMTTEHHILHI